MSTFDDVEYLVQWIRERITLPGYQLKVDGLQKDPKYRDQMGQKLDGTVLKLKDQGDGRYALKYTDTKTPGSPGTSRSTRST